MKDKRDIAKYRNAPAAEIEAKVLELKKSLMEARFALANGSIKDTSVVSRMRHAIATLSGYATNKQAPKAKTEAKPKVKVAAPAKAAVPAKPKAAPKKPATKKTKEAKDA